MPPPHGGGGAGLWGSGRESLAAAAALWVGGTRGSHGSLWVAMGYLLAPLPWLGWREWDGEVMAVGARRIPFVGLCCEGGMVLPSRAKPRIAIRGSWGVVLMAS
jgi:hypothetical protein